MLNGLSTQTTGRTWRRPSMPTFCTQFITDVEHTQQTGRQTHRGRQAHRQTERGTQAGRQTDQGGKAHTGATVNARFLHSIVCYVTRLLSMGDVVLGGSLLLKKIARFAKVSEPDTFKKLCMKAHMYWQVWTAMCAMSLDCSPWVTWSLGVLCC